MATFKKDAIYGIIDQGLISLSNLGIGFLLIKLTSKDNYGLYGIGFAAILLCIGIANALVTSQMTIFAPEKPDKIKYCCSMLLGQYFIFIPFWIVFAAISFTIFYLELINLEVLTYMLVLSATVMAAIFHEFMRRYFYIALKPYRVLQIDIVNITVIFSSLLIAVIYKINLSHITAIIIYGAGALMGGILGLILAKLLQKITFSEITVNIKEAWHHGQWALGGVIVTWLQSQGYIALLSILATTSSIAEANAARLLLAPIGVISSSLGQVFIPRLAILKNEGKDDAVIAMAHKILLFILTILSLIVLGVYFLKDYVISHFFTNEYANIDSLVFLWAFVYIAMAVRTNTSILLQIYKRFRIITICNTFTAVITITLGYFFIKTNGIDGSIQSLLLGELLLALLLSRAFHAYRKNKY